MSIKVGLLTIYNTYNYGAVLQAYATYKALNSLGVDVLMINYDPKTLREERKLFLPNTAAGNIFRNIRTIKNIRAKRSRQHNFNDFIGQFNTTKDRWEEAYDFSSLDVDCILTGSDQTFCLHLRDNPEEMKAFFLPQTGKQRKVSYAPSMGEKYNMITPDEREWMKEKLNKFDSLSVRDVRSADYIEELIGKRPEVVLDPTLLISTEEWKTICNGVTERHIPDKYIAFYSVLSEPWVVAYVNDIAKRLNLPVVALHPQNRYEINTHYKRFDFCGPKEFIDIIQKASYVITTSFHATIFSMVFEKPLLTLICGEGNRLRNHLQTFKMESSMITKEINPDVSKFFTEYDQSKIVLGIEKTKSLSYLRKSIFK